MQVPKLTNEGDPVTGLLLCQKNSFVPIWSRWSTQVYTPDVLAQSYSVCFAREEKKHGLDCKQPALPTLSEFFQVFWDCPRKVKLFLLLKRKQNIVDFQFFICVTSSKPTLSYKTVNSNKMMNLGTQPK